MKYNLIFAALLLIFLTFSCDSRDEAKSADSADADAGTDVEFVYDWEKAVKEAWGEPPDLETRLALFDAVWQAAADDYACFETFGIDWDTKYDEFLPRIESADSYGRFAEVLMRVTWGLSDPHTYVRSEKVCRAEIRERPPIDLTGVSAYSTVFGTCVTATEDNELVVYRVDTESNALNLEIGDEIIGYDGKTWAKNMEQIEAAELPPCGRVSAVPEAYDYSRQASVLMNSHLFSTLEIKRRKTGEIESIDLLDVYDTALPQAAPTELICPSQMPIEGIDFPQTKLSELESQNAVSWGVLPGTNTGYIYVYRWLDGDALDFDRAVQDLMETDALIIDQRLNLGGRYILVYFGLPFLFGEDTKAVDFYVRDSKSDDYTALEFWFSTVVEADPETVYDKPIAVLIGPDAMSGGDMFPYVMAKHPKVRLFGKPTAGGFGGIKMSLSPDSYTQDFTVMVTDSVMVEPTTGQRLGDHINTPDTHVWLTKDDIIAGVDTVVESALEWIAGES